MHVGFASPRGLGKRSRHSRRMRNPQSYVSGKRPIAKTSHAISTPAMHGGNDKDTSPVINSTISTFLVTFLSVAYQNGWDEYSETEKMLKVCGDQMLKFIEYFSIIVFSHAMKDKWRHCLQVSVKYVSLVAGSLCSSLIVCVHWGAGGTMNCRYCCHVECYDTINEHTIN